VPPSALPPHTVTLTRCMARLEQDRCLANPRITVHFYTGVDDAYGSSVLQGLRLVDTRSGAAWGAARRSTAQHGTARVARLSMAMHGVARQAELGSICLPNACALLRQAGSIEP
jgi:hypothetical protein